MKPLALIAALLFFPIGQSQACNTADLMEKLYASGGGAGQVLTGRPITQCAWATPDQKFIIHFDTTGSMAVFGSDIDVNPPDGIPDYVNRTADYLTLAYDSLITGIGFDPPPDDGMQGGDGRYDIYLTFNLGLTTPEEPSFQYPGRPAYTSFIQLGHDLRFSSRYGDDPYPFLKASVAHEFFHAIEFAYRAYSTDRTFWWFEACANWAEERVFDDVNDVYYSLPSYLPNLQHSLYMTNGQFIYGAWLFPEFIDERFGPEMILNCWNKFARYDFSIDAIMYALQGAGADINTEYCLHTIWNYFTGNNSLVGFYREGANFDTSVLVAATHTQYPVNWTMAPWPLENMSASYISFTRADDNISNLIIEYNNITSDKQAVCLAVVRQNAPVQYGIYQVSSEIHRTLMINRFSRGDVAILMPVWIFESNPKEEFSTYQYCAYLQDTMTAITENGAAPISEYSLDSVYPNPFNGAVTISFDAPASGPYTVRIYDITGRAIAERDGISRQGSNHLTWQAPADLASGVLFYIIDFGQKRLDGKMSLLK
jgi:hypothetical protein